MKQSRRAGLSDSFGLTFFISLVNEYLSSGKYAGKLKEYQAIGIGFVDGDLQILYAR